MVTWSTAWVCQDQEVDFGGAPHKGMTRATATGIIIIFPNNVQRHQHYDNLQNTLHPTPTPTLPPSPFSINIDKSAYSKHSPLQKKIKKKKIN